MKRANKGINTICTHTGAVEDTVYKGATSPLYMSTSYAFEGVDEKRYPRYFNTPNQQGLSKKIAALENGEAALVFGSGMAAISTSLLAFLQAGDHVLLQSQLYGGTYSLVTEQFERYGISYSFTKGMEAEDFYKELRDNTRVVYLETPSNPLLQITDIAAVAGICRERGLISMIDNTFASPVNQNPIDLGIDLVIHSATKYMGGHSDICAGAVVSGSENIRKVFTLGRSLGGNLSDYTVWLLERSLKTMGIRVRAQNENAMKMAEFLKGHSGVRQVFYPGLESHPQHELARRQMKGFGGMLSFELQDHLDAAAFQNALKLVKPSMSLAGVESTVSSPYLTSHSLIPAAEREKLGISDRLIRFSLGIEDFDDLSADFQQAFDSVSSEMAAH